METTCYESTNQKTHGLNAMKARQAGELSDIQTTDPEQGGTSFQTFGVRFESLCSYLCIITADTPRPYLLYIIFTTILTILR